MDAIDSSRFGSFQLMEEAFVFDLALLEILQSDCGGTDQIVNDSVGQLKNLHRFSHIEDVGTAWLVLNESGEHEAGRFASSHEEPGGLLTTNNDVLVV